MNVVFTDFVQPDLELEAALLREAGLPMSAADPHCRTAEEVIAAANGAEALVVLYAPITEDVFAALPKLKIVSLPLVGVDAVDVEAAKRHGVWVAHVPDAWVPEVGIHAAAMALSLIRHLPFYDRSVREGRWDYQEPGVLRRPTTLTFGLFGCGRIGRMAAKAAAPSFGRVIGFDPFVAADAWPEGIERVTDLTDLFRQADVVSLHAPLTAETQHVVNGSLLAEMKRGSFIVNASRGALIDPAALLAALDSGQLGGAGLDVFEQEPADPEDPLLRHPRTLVCPHAAYYSAEADEEGRSRAIHNVIAYARSGRPLHYVVEGRK